MITVVTGRRNVTKYAMTTTAPSTANNIEKTNTVLKPDLGSGVSSVIGKLDPLELSKAWPPTITLSDLLFERKLRSVPPAVAGGSARYYVVRAKTHPLPQMVLT